MICSKHRKPIGYFAISENIRQSNENTFRCEECMLLQPGSKIDSTERVFSINGTLENKKNELLFLRKKICKNVEKVVSLHHTQVNEFNQQINEIIEELVKRLITIKHVNFKLLETWIKENEQQINKYFFTENNSKTLYDLSQIISNPGSTPQQVKQYFDSYLKQIKTIDLISSLHYNQDNINFFKGYLSQIASLVQEFDTSFSPKAVQFFSQRSPINIEFQMKAISQQFVQQQYNYFDYMLKRCQEIKMKSQTQLNQGQSPRPNIVEELLKLKQKEPVKQQNIEIVPQISTNVNCENGSTSQYQEPNGSDQKQQSDFKKKKIINLNKNHSNNQSPCPRSQAQGFNLSQETKLVQNPSVNLNVNEIINNFMQNPQFLASNNSETINNQQRINQRLVFLQDNNNLISEKRQEGTYCVGQQQQFNYGVQQEESRNSQNSSETLGVTYQNQEGKQDSLNRVQIQTQQNNNNGGNTPTQKNLNSLSLYQQKITPMQSTPFSNQESPLSYPQSHSSDLFHKYSDALIPSYSSQSRQEETSNLVNHKNLSESKKKKIAAEENIWLKNKKDSNSNSSKTVIKSVESVQNSKSKEQIRTQLDKYASSEKDQASFSQYRISQGQTNKLAPAAQYLSRETVNNSICMENEISANPTTELGQLGDSTNENQNQSEMIQEEHVVMDDFPDILNNLPNILDSLSNIIDPQQNNNDQQQASTTVPSNINTNFDHNIADQTIQKQSSARKITKSTEILPNYLNDPSQQSNNHRLEQFKDQIDQIQSFSNQQPHISNKQTLATNQQQILQPIQLNQLETIDPQNYLKQNSNQINNIEPIKQTQKSQESSFQSNQEIDQQYQYPAQIIGIQRNKDSDKENECIQDSKKGKEIILKIKGSLTGKNLVANSIKNSDAQCSYEFIDTEKENQFQEYGQNQEPRSSSIDSFLKSPPQNTKKGRAVENSKEKTPIRVFSLENSLNKKRSSNEAQNNQEDAVQKRLIIDAVDDKQDQSQVKIDLSNAEKNPSTKTFLFRGKKIIRKPGPTTEEGKTEENSPNSNKRIIQVETITQREEIESNSDDSKLEQRLPFITQSYDNFKVFKNKFAQLEKKSR